MNWIAQIRRHWHCRDLRNFLSQWHDKSRAVKAAQAYWKEEYENLQVQFSTLAEWVEKAEPLVNQHEKLLQEKDELTRDNIRMRSQINFLRSDNDSLREARGESHVTVMHRKEIGAMTRRLELLQTQLGECTRARVSAVFSFRTAVRACIGNSRIHPRSLSMGTAIITEGWPSQGDKYELC